MNLAEAIVFCLSKMTISGHSVIAGYPPAAPEMESRPTARSLNSTGTIKQQVRSNSRCDPKKRANEESMKVLSKDTHYEEDKIACLTQIKKFDHVRTTGVNWDTDVLSKMREDEEHEETDEKELQEAPRGPREVGDERTRRSHAHYI